MIGIYCITNTINTKKYIGQSIDIDARWYNHRKDYRNPKSSSYNTYFYQALRKYGIENFSFDVIEECMEYELDTKEISWIDKLHTNNREYGYNTTNGGDGVRGYWDKPVYQYSLDGEFIAAYKSVKDAQRQIGITDVGYCASGKGKSAGGYIWSYIKFDSMPKYVRGHTTTEVYQYALDGTYMQSYPSILEASKSTGVAYRNINSCIHSDSQIRGGDYMWTNKKFNCLPPYKRNLRKSPPVIQFGLDGNIVAEYDSLAGANEATGVPKINISRCCKGHSKTAGGYRWQYKE